MRFDSIQITKMENGFLVSCMSKPNAFTKTPPGQWDYVFPTFKDVLDFLTKGGL